jgi:methyl-accepting chemotaxis protein
MNSLFNKIDLAKRLILFTVFSTLLVAFSISLPTYFSGKSIIYESTETQIEIIRESKKQELTEYFQSKINDVKIFRKGYFVTEGFLELRKAFDEFTKNNDQDKAMEELRKTYLFANNKTGFSLDNSNYTKVLKKISPYFNSIIKEKNYYDLFLVDARTGNVLFTVAKEDDYMTNLLSGKYKDTNLGKLFRKILSNNDSSNDVLVSEYEPYAPSNNEINAFIGSSVYIEGKIEVVLIMQLPLAEISEKVRRPIIKNLNETSYLVGSDYLIRSDVEDKPKESIILKKKIDTIAVKKALLGESGVSVIDSPFDGKRIFSSYTPLELLGQKFAIIIDLNYDTTLSNYNSFQNRTLFLTLTVLAIMIVASYVLSKSLSSPIKESVNLLSTSLREISSVIENHERNANMQSASVNETTTTLNNISNSSRLSSDESMIVTNKAKDAEEMSTNGHSSVVEMLNSIDQLKEKVSGIAEQIMKLSEKNSQISNIISLVSELANETNMLALNAAVEAARAGENGKGFEVVAVEIRKLADESKKSAFKIQEIVFEIKNATDSTVMATEEGVKQAEQSYKMGNKLLNSLSGINQSVSGVFDSIEKISLNIRQQSISISEIVDAMNSINRGAQETASGTAQTKVGVDQITDATRRLKELVEGKVEII